MLAALIKRYDKIISFQERGATSNDCINTMYQFIKPFLDNEMSVFEEYEAFNKFPHTYLLRSFKHARTHARTNTRIHVRSCVLAHIDTCCGILSCCGSYITFKTGT